MKVKYFDTHAEAQEWIDNSGHKAKVKELYLLGGETVYIIIKGQEVLHTDEIFRY